MTYSTNNTDKEKTEEENLGSFYMGRMRPPPEPERILPKGTLTVAAVIAFAGIVWYAYPQGSEKYTDVDVPVITADTSSYKAAPDDPGGMEIRHQDSTVFDSLDKSGAKQAERLLPQQEEPLDKAQLGLDSKTPGLNLDPQMQTAPAGTTAVVTEAPAAPATPVAAEPAPAVAKEPSAPLQPGAKEAAVTETPKVADIAPAAGQTASEGDTYIQLGSYRGKTGAQKGWAEMQKKFPQLLKGLTMRTEQINLGKKGTFHRLQAGKTTPAQAKEICDALKKSGNAGCLVVK